jgi:hypothetical protein
LFIFNYQFKGGENVSYYPLPLIRIINDLINKAILNQCDPIVKIINSTLLTSWGNKERTPIQHVEKTEMIIK